MKATGLSDNELLLGFQSGSEVCFDELLSRYEGKVFRLIKLVSGDVAVAEAVLYEVFIELAKKAYAGLHEVLPESLRAVIFELALKRFEEKRERELLLGVGESLISQMSCESIREEEDEGEQVLVKAIQRLPLIHRKVFVLRDIFSVDTNEVSSLLRLSREDAKMLLQRARRIIQRNLPVAELSSATDESRSDKQSSTLLV